MEANKYWQLEKEYHPIKSEHDLIIRVIEHEKVTRTEGDCDNMKEITESVPKKVHEFQVKREVVIKASPYFQRLLNVDGDSDEPEQSIIDLIEGSVEGIIVILKILQGATFGPTELKNTSMAQMWEVAGAADKYKIHPKKSVPGFKAWFENWYSANAVKAGGKRFDFRDHQALLLPCYLFDHAVGFAAATRFLATRAIGQYIVERRPNGCMVDLCLDRVVTQQLNAAKSRLKTILHRSLYKPIDELLNSAECDCRRDVLFDYQKALTRTGAWPLETSFTRMAVADILHRLGSFWCSFEGPDVCNECDFDAEGTVSAAEKEVWGYFGGLCLDCMNASQPENDESDEEYWKHAEQGMQWDAGCRIRHNQPTWYFSFMGERAKMNAWKQRSKTRGNARDDGNENA